MSNNSRSELPANALGLTGFVVGCFAMLVAWVPFFGSAAIPPAIVGLLLSFVGLINSRTSRRTASGWTIAGILINAVALATVVWVTVSLDITLGSELDKFIEELS